MQNDIRFNQKGTRKRIEESTRICRQRQKSKGCGVSTVEEMDHTLLGFTKVTNKKDCNLPTDAVN